LTCPAIPLKGGTMTVLLTLVGIDFALIWGVLYFFMSFAPSSGLSSP